MLSIVMTKGSKARTFDLFPKKILDRLLNIKLYKILIYTKYYVNEIFLS